MAEHVSILFLCTGNSARSIMAEAIVNARATDRLRARSAGASPKPEPHPLALETLARHGFPTAGLHSKHWEACLGERFDLVVTLCDRAAGAACPVLPGAPLTVHWGFPDPPASADPPAAFERVFCGLEDAIQRFAASDEADLARRAEAIADHVRVGFPSA